MTRDEYIKAIRLCAYGHHKVRQNKYGVCWCVRCGYLFRNLSYTPLTDEDKVVVNGIPNTSIVTMDIEGTIPKAFGRRTIEII
nr:MAG TPA: 50S ribosomal subunit [Caudoviricetes sp.]